jgi:hypothetical protein
MLNAYNPEFYTSFRVFDLFIIEYLGMKVFGGLTDNFYFRVLFPSFQFPIHCFLVALRVGLTD